jgi:hypothetical protein
MTEQNDARRWLATMRPCEPASRQCGGCRMCCHVDDIPGVKKAWEACRHFCEAGCDLYGNQPPICAKFECWWKANLVPDELRPDRCGLVVSLHGPAAMVSEGWKDAREGALARAIIRGLRTIYGLVVCRRFGNAGIDLFRGEVAIPMTAQGHPRITGSRMVSAQRGTRVGRNDECPCGSGLKFKKCCLRRDGGEWGVSV